MPACYFISSPSHKPAWDVCEFVTPPDTVPSGRRTLLLGPHPGTVTVRSFTRSKVAIESWCDQARQNGTSRSFSRMKRVTIVSAVAELVGKTSFTFV